MRARLTHAFVTAAILLPAMAAGQANSAQNGVWLSAGAGGGWTRVSCGVCSVDRNLGLSGYLRIGTYVRNGFLLGAEANGWTRKRGEEGRDWVGGIGAVGYLYPKPEGQFYIKAGLGYLSFHSTENQGNGDSTGSVGVQLGAGYEFRVAPRLYITNFANLLASSFGTLRGDNAEVIGDVGVTLFQVGVGLTHR